MLSVAIVGILAAIGGPLLLQVNRYFILSQARSELQSEARAIMYVVSRELRQAQSNTLRIDRMSNSQPFYSRITFTKVQGLNMTFHQNGTHIVQIAGNNTKTLSRNLRYLAFSFPRSDDMTIVSVSLTLEKTIYEGRTKALHVASEKVRVMN
jgi:Tfp pilus assembly protein PilE